MNSRDSVFNHQDRKRLDVNNMKLHERFRRRIKERCVARSLNWDGLRGSRVFVDDAASSRGLLDAISEKLMRTTNDSLEATIFVVDTLSAVGAHTSFAACITGGILMPAATFVNKGPYMTLKKAVATYKEIWISNRFRQNNPKLPGAE